MSLLDRLGHPDDEVRLEAARVAAGSGELGLVDKLLDLALHDNAEVRTIGGIAEVYEHVGDAAAGALGKILGRRNGLDPRIRAVALDLDQDDDRVASLLYYLGARYEPLRQELETHAEDQVRLRAIRAVLSIHRTTEFGARFLTDTSAAVRVEALNVARGHDSEVYLRFLRDDPSPRVREVAARSLRFSPAIGSEPFIAAARVENDPAVRIMLLSCLTYRRRDRANVLAIVAFLADAAVYVRRAARDALRTVDDATVGAAVAFRVLIEPDDAEMCGLLHQKHLLTHAPGLRDLLERLLRYKGRDRYWHVLPIALAVPGPPDEPARGDPADGLDEPQRTRLHREALRQAVTVIEPCVARAPDHGEAGALASLVAWLAAPSQSTRAALVAVLEAENGTHPSKINHVWDCLRAAVSGDVQYALRTGQRVAAEAARRDQASRELDPARGPVIAARRAYALARLAQAYTARLIRAGADPMPPGRLCRLLLDGEDPVEALNEAAAVPDITYGDVLVAHTSDGRTVSLGYNWPAALSARFQPERASLLVLCAECGTWHRAEGAIAWEYVDDDHYAGADHGFVGTLHGACPTCGADRYVQVRLTVTRSRIDDSAEAVWDERADR
ncbi:hypothetical protein [Paractinoplanes brasiliensis]|uniref:HEAT repeat protein n=1 Tax=Paractinoplanes brasiliensis TaxID=52695 RepID=A0A4R6JQS9_9ACTN|nr:hypothetical protein [Actinoplanes brasiliensis]TDO36995.1 hypothetical protein C8E87_0587 [Actinoplanes brasiliensis]GID30518.1 hypothetical protein Abr02nite_55010 [Actinoplanes brasiliensis]